MAISQPRGGLILSFLNAAAFGVVCPLLFYIIKLPDAIWISALIVVDSLGRLLGRRWFFNGHHSNAFRRLIGQILFALSFVLLMLAQRCSPAIALGVIYLSRFVGGFSVADFDLVRSVAGGEERLAVGRGSIYISMVGFAVGCGICAGIIPHGPVVTLLYSSTLELAAAVGLVISMLGVLVALLWRAEGLDFGPAAESRSASATLVFVLTEMAFGMNFCVLPLMMWETFFVNPGELAIFFAVGAMAVAATEWAMPRITGRSAIVVLLAGLAMAMVGFAGFVISWWIAFADPSAIGVGRGFWVLCGCWTLATIGFAMLRSVWGRSARAVDERGESGRRVFGSGDAACIASAVGAVTAGLLWATHERTSFAVPALLVGVGIVMVLVRGLRKNSTG